MSEHTGENAIFTAEYQYQILKLFFTNSKFGIEYGNLLKEEYFETKTLSIIFGMGKRILYRYEKSVQEDDLIVEMEEYILSKGLQDSIRSIIKTEIKAIYKIHIQSEQFILDKLIKFARRQEMKKALLSGADILENDGSYESVLQLVSNAVSIGYGNDDGLNFSSLADFPKMYKEIYNVDNLIKTGFHSYDRALGGGYAPREVHVIMASPKCSSGCTRISLLDGTNPTLEELYTLGRKEFWIYSCKPDGTIVPGRASNLQITKHVTELIEVELDNGEKVKFTPDHRFMLRDGSYKEVQYLEPGDSLMPLYLREADETEFMPGRPIVKDNKTGKEDYVHRVVMKSLKGDYPDWADHIHHKDRNPLNNTPENLEYLSRSAHTQEHRDERSEMMTSLWLTEEFRKAHHDSLVSRNLENWQVQEYKAKMLEVLRKGQETIHNHPDRLKWCSKGGIAMMSNPEYRKALHGREISEEERKIHAEVGSKVMTRLWQDPTWAAENSRKSSERMTLNNPAKTEEFKKNHSIKMKSIGHKLSSSMKNNFKNPEYVRNLKYKNCLRVVKGLLEKDLEVNQKNYEAERKLSCLTKYRGCGSWSVYVENTPNYNHKVKSIKTITYETPVPVYDITVDEHHNFALTAGVFVHNCGKTTIGANIGAFVAGAGKVVFHITLEISALDLMSKYAARLSNLTYEEVIGSVEGSDYHQRIARFDKYSPKLFINYWTEQSASTLTIRSWISKICSKEDVKPDLIIIDYDDLLLPTTGRSDDMYNEAGQIYTDLKGLADYFSCSLLTFSQPQRQAWHKPNNNELVTAADLAHSARKAHKAWSISSLNFADDKDVGLLFMDMVRRGKSHTKIKLCRDLTRGRFYEPEEA